MRHPLVRLHVVIFFLYTGLEVTVGQWSFTILTEARHEAGKVIIGQHDVIEKALIAIFTGNHALIEGVPGVAKTLLVRTLAQVLTEEYSEFGVHVANVVIDGTIDSPGTRAMPRVQNRPDLVINPTKIAEAFYYLHTQDRSCWTHELQLTPFSTKPSY